MRGGAARGLAPWPAARKRAEQATARGTRPRRGRPIGPVLSDNPVVSHASKTTVASGSGTTNLSTNSGPLRIADPRRREGEATASVIVTNEGGQPSRDAMSAAIGNCDSRRVRPGRCRCPCEGTGPVADRIGVVKLLRARGGCLGVIRDTGVEGCDKSGGVAQRTSIPECLSRPGELKHLSTRRKGNQPRLPQ